MHVALGRAYRNRRVHQGAVVYLALEGVSGFANRVEAWRQRYLNGHPGPVPFYLVNSTVDSIREHGELIGDKGASRERPPRWSSSTRSTAAWSATRTNPRAVAKFVRAADAIRAAFDCAVVIIHHCGVEGSLPRGHSSLSGADDGQLSVARGADIDLF
jgi:hypothetical protein